MAILQRKDLAKEFSAIVLQEIKNHNDAVLASNMSLDEFRRVLAELSKSVESRVAKVSSEIGLHKVSVDEVKGIVKDAVSKCERALHDSDQELRRMIKSLQDGITTRESYYLTIQGFAEFKAEVDKWISSIKAMFAKQQDTLRDEIKRSFLDYEHLVKCLKSELDKAIKDVDTETKKINHQLDGIAVNFAGYTRELEIAKKRCFVIEKKLEDLYTQMSRIKEGKS